MANPTTPRMVGRRFAKGKVHCLKPTAKKNGPHRLYLCWLDDGSDRGQLILVQGNNLRSRGYSGAPLRRAA
jgi:hypothetical protein